MRYAPRLNHSCDALRVKKSTLQGLGLVSEAVFQAIMVDISLLCSIVVVRRAEIFDHPVTAVSKTAVAVAVAECELDRGSETSHILQRVINGFEPRQKIMLIRELALLCKPQAI